MLRGPTSEEEFEFPRRIPDPHLGWVPESMPPTVGEHCLESLTFGEELRDLPKTLPEGSVRGRARTWAATASER